MGQGYPEGIDRLSVIGELLRMLISRKRWVLIPAVIVTATVGLLLLFVQASPIAPFLYPLF